VHHIAPSLTSVVSGVNDKHSTDRMSSTSPADTDRQRDRRTDGQGKGQQDTQPVTRLAQTTTRQTKLSQTDNRQKGTHAHTLNADMMQFNDSNS